MRRVPLPDEKNDACVGRQAYLISWPQRHLNAGSSLRAVKASHGAYYAHQAPVVLPLTLCLHPACQLVSTVKRAGLPNTSSDREASRRHGDGSRLWLPVAHAF